MALKLHPRFFKVKKAAAKFQNMMLDLDQQFDLTEVEWLGIMTAYIQDGFLKYMLREERHPNNLDKKADEA